MACSNHPRVRLVHASQVVGMGEKPIVALRTLKDSSMRVTLDLVKSGAADACVQCRQHRCLDGHGQVRAQILARC